jgi:hypothetical protein
MLNDLEMRDLGGARVEARRLAVMERYIRDDLHEEGSSALGLGAFLAGFVFEKSDQPDEALRWYDQALDFTGYLSLRGPVRALMSRGPYRTPRLRQLESEGPPPSSLEDANEGEIVFVVGYGRVPPKVPERIPIGLALTLYSSALSPSNVAAANAMAAQGLVTWINFPALGREQGEYSVPMATLDGRYVQLEQAADVAADVRDEWKRVEGRVIVSAITRMAVRFAAGTALNAAASATHDGLVGALLAVGSIGTQATLAALDTPDTRSWETLPARVAIARVRVPAGRHAVRIDARGYVRTAEVEVERGGWALVSAMGLR